MDRNDQDAIASLFERLAEVERRTPRRDPQAEAFIRQQIAAQPAAPYYLAQTVIVQQQALEAAQERIAELEARVSGGRANRRGWAAPQPAYDNRPQPWGGGGFLAGAAQTAMGVAGGVLLGNMLAGALFGGNDAQAADNDDAGNDDADNNDADNNDADNGDAGGGDWGGGDGGGFDGGGGE
jgi:hypothetical protein